MKTKEIKILVSPQEKEKIKESAKRLGMGMSAYLRMRGLKNEI